MSTTVPQLDDQNKGKNDRSPAYPFISLKTAIERAKQLYKAEKRTPAPVSVVVKHWGYKEKSSGGIQTIAALKYYGLLADTGSGEARKVQLSDAGLKIVMDERTVSQERDNLIKQAALRPKIYAKLWEMWGSSMPSEENVNYYLRVELKFADNVVPNFIRGYKDTISFANLNESDKVLSEEGKSGDPYVPQVGDYVQWESQGVQQFREPAKVLSLSTDRIYAFVEGTATGLPIAQLTRAAAPIRNPQIPVVRTPLLPNNTMQEDVYSLPEGRVVVQWPTVLSAASIEEVKDYLKLLERKITRSTEKASPPQDES